MSTSVPSISVLIATHNGALTLPRVLEALAMQAPAIESWQLLVADNDSTDDTAQVLASFSSRLPLQVLSVKRRGKNVALNAAIPHARGDLLLLTDDDIVVPPDWLLSFQQSAIAHPHIDLFGGPIEALWPDDGVCPNWISRLVNIGATFGVTPSALLEGPVKATQVWGGNMAVRRRVFEAGFRFNESVGPAAGQYAMGSEVELSARLADAGHQAWFIKKAVVGHIIRSTQLSSEWIVARAYRLGRHSFLSERHLIAADAPSFRGAPRWRWRQYGEQYLRYAWARLRRDHDALFLAEWELSYLRGYLDEAARDAAGKRP